ncbi:MAG: phytanoyl-CoA dioxygenase family protein [Gammaproteobacteria bacterium]|nr:phytanoyl-CoA dioxygenase family protein [Gammaproteobacteria bacterium]
MQENEFCSNEIKDQLRRDGIAGPLPLADTSRLDEVYEEVSKLKAERREQLRKLRETGESLENVVNPLIDRHMDVKVISDVFFDANLQAATRELFGTDLFVWRTNFFVKSDGTGQNKWHHDRHFEDGFTPINLYDTRNHFTVTIALTDIGMDQGRLEYVKGSHQPIDGFDRDIPRHFLEVPEVIEDRVTPLPMKKGEFVLFHGALLHRSLEFGRGERRMSMAGRLARNGTAIPTYGAPNPAGGAQTEAEPFVYYRETGILQFN